LFPLVTVPRTRASDAAAFVRRSSRFPRFFCLVRRACRLRVGSTLRTVEVWKRGRGVMVDDDADANVAAVALEAIETKVQDIQDA
jgi:hypothetical protein